MDQTERIVAVVREALDDSVVGAYLHGSAVMGALHPMSDIDVLVVTQRPTTLDEKRNLIARLCPSRAAVTQLAGRDQSS